MANWTVGELFPLKGQWYRVATVLADGQVGLIPTGKETAGHRKRRLGTKAYYREVARETWKQIENGEIPVA